MIPLALTVSLSLMWLDFAVTTYKVDHVAGRSVVFEDLLENKFLTGLQSSIFTEEKQIDGKYTSKFD